MATKLQTSDMPKQIELNNDRSGVITVELSANEVWIVLRALADANRDAVNKNSIETRARTWISNRLLNLTERHNKTKAG